MSAIVGVHGIWNFLPGQSPSTAGRHLAATWHNELSTGPLGHLVSRIPVTMAYYAHRLRPIGKQASPESLDRLDPQVEVMVSRWLEAWNLAVGAPQGRMTGSLRQHIGRLARHLGRDPDGLGQFAVGFFSEVNRYLDPNMPARHLARTEVANAIAAAPDDRIIIAHSLGSVVTYETLHHYPHLTANLLVTIGSPLALPSVVFDRLKPEPNNGRGTRPPGVRRWINIADPGDVIAIPPHGIRDAFDGLDEDFETSIHWADFHTAGNYLKTAALANALRPYLNVHSSDDQPSGPSR